MAGSFETLQTVTKIGPTIVERMVTLEYTSDAADGSVPDAELEDLENYIIDEVITLPAAAPNAPAAYRVMIKDEDEGILFLGTARSTSAKERQGGYEYSGKAPAIDSTIELSLVSTANPPVAVNLGNGKEVSVTLRLRRKAL
jgi:hypothetical protein